MANPIKYNTLTETRALNTGDFWIGTGDTDKGPTSNTGYYVGPNVPSNGYVIYLYKDSQPGDLTYHIASNDSELISFTNKLASTSYTTVNECLNYFATQDDKVCFNRDYEDIVTDGLIFNLDAGFSPSYPRNGTSWYNLGSNNGTLTNGPTFDTDGGGSILFDGADDWVATSLNTEISNCDSVSGNEFTVITWIKPSGTSGIICGAAGGIGGSTTFAKYMNGSTFNIRIKGTSSNNTVKSGLSNSLYHMVSYTWDGTTGLGYYNNEEPVEIGIGSVANQGYNFGLADPTNGSLTNYPRFSGNIAISLIYNKALSSTEISQNYNAQKSRFGL